MEPTTPVVKNYEKAERVLAEDQPQYTPLPVVATSDGKIISRWKFSDEERKAIADGADLHIAMWTFDSLPQPVKPFILSGGSELEQVLSQVGSTYLRVNV